MAWLGCCKLVGLTIALLALLVLIIVSFFFIDAYDVTVGVQDVRITSLNITQYNSASDQYALSADFDLIVRANNPGTRSNQVRYKNVELALLYDGITIASGPMSTSPFTASKHVSTAFFYPHLSAGNVVLPAGAALSLKASMSPPSTSTSKDKLDSLVRLTFVIRAAVDVRYRKAGFTLHGVSAYVCRLYLEPPIVTTESGNADAGSSQVAKRFCKTLHTYVTDERRSL
ncbi:hypothetical protein GOP47_0029554 [Adiantum capillus-veneris]|nr:hypothetical protein GOP47_0029554 [Adiantum capillus-veneris]